MYFLKTILSEGNIGNQQDSFTVGLKQHFKNGTFKILTPKIQF